MDFIYSYVILAEVFAIAALSTNLLVGIIGIFSVSQAAIFGTGAYITALLTLSGTTSFLVATVLAIVACALLNVMLALPSLRLAGDYFVVTSFGSQIVATAIFINWSGVTGGAAGLPGIPAPKFFGLDMIELGHLLVLSSVTLALACIAYWLLMRSPFGRVVHAIREDEPAVVAAGKHVLRAKVSVSAISGAFAGAGGSVYAVFMTFIDPPQFDIHVSVLMLTMLVVGGARTLVGSIIGPFILLAIPQVLALVALPPTILGPVRQLAYGVLLVAFMLFRPQGIAGRRL